MVKNVKDSKVLEKIRTRDVKTRDAFQVGEVVKIIEGRFEGMHGKIMRTSEGLSRVFIIENGKIDMIPNINLKSTTDSKTKDTKITITIEDDRVVPEPEEKGKATEVQPEEYKGFTIMPVKETGEFDIYSMGGALVAHTENLELAKSFIDSVDTENKGEGHGN
jgi:hypothetical protein